MDIAAAVALACGLFALAVAALVVWMDREATRRILDAQGSAVRALQASHDQVSDQLNEARARVRALEGMIDERRANELGVAMPPTVAQVADLPELPGYLQKELRALEDPDAQMEFEALARSMLVERPEIAPDDLIASLFGGR
jgi:hypothetical protein